jgi:hypothetical protein
MPLFLSVQYPLCSCITEKHDFKLFKDNKARWVKTTEGLVESGYQGITKLPKKKRKKKPLTQEEQKKNRIISSRQIANEHAIGFLKRFKVISECYRNR